jgi:dephospho-CoA kinase
MLKIGITGGIGSGKSLVSKIFNNYGIPIFNADNAAKFLMEKDTSLIEAIKNTFGEDIYVNGQLQRQQLADLVFHNKIALDKLNALVHPRVIAYGNEWHSRQNAPFTIKEAALFFESGSYKEMDFIIGVYAPLETRIARTIQRDQIDRASVLARISKQMNEDEKMKRCNFVINNYTPFALLPQVDKLFHQLNKA